ncbi:MAG: hypothetical protein HRT45_10645 [Bdellovibrionales bacterium]|nr:hypothetical protein [Bdellovibrionales bacterium]
MSWKPESLKVSSSLLEALRVESGASSAHASSVWDQSNQLNTLEYQDQVFQLLIEKIEKRSKLGLQAPVGVSTWSRAKRNDFLQVLYDKEMVLADTLSFALSDKLIAAKIFEHYIGPTFHRYHPRTEGLVAFFVAHGFIDSATGELKASRQQVREAFEAEFPDGFVVKPTSGWSSKGRTFFKNIDEVLHSLFEESDGGLYSKADYFEPFFSEELQHVVSGERYIVQSSLGETEGLSEKGTKQEILREYRSHSLWGSVVPKATKGRWIGANPGEPERLAVAQFLQDFLDSLPLGLRQGQAWSFDIVQVSDSKFGIVEVNTNRGMRNHWSGSLHNPRIIGAYARHLRDRFGWRLQGFSGLLLYNNYANRNRYKRHNQATRKDHNAEE